VDERELLNQVWPCKAWFCRLVARRVLEYFVSRSIAYRSVQVGGERGVVSMGSPELDLVKELKELKSTVNELKTALAEIKAALADLTGPFSYYKPPVEEKREAQLTPVPSQQPVPPATTATPGAPEKPTSPAREGEKPSTPVLEKVLPAMEEAERIIREERSRLVGASLKRVLGLMKTLYEIRRLYPKASVEDVINLLDQLSIINKNEVSILKAAMNTVENSLRENIKPEENMLLIYLLLRNLGVRDEALEEEVLRTVMDSLSTMRKKPRGEQGTPVSTSSSEGGSNKWESQPQ
jgi:hypothetical protein